MPRNAAITARVDRAAERVDGADAAKF